MQCFKFTSESQRFLSDRVEKLKLKADTDFVPRAKVQEFIGVPLEIGRGGSSAGWFSTRPRRKRGCLVARIYPGEFMGVEMVEGYLKSRYVTEKRPTKFSKANLPSFLSFPFLDFIPVIELRSCILTFVFDLELQDENGVLEDFGSCNILIWNCV